MSDQDVKFTKKHLARNVPEDFLGCCERIRQGQFRSQSAQRPGLIDYRRIYGALFKSLTETEFDQPSQERIGKELDEIQIRFLAIQKTLDQSVPAKPVYDTLHRLNRLLANAIKRLDDPDRDQIVEEISGINQAKKSSGLQQRFQDTASLAEKVTVVRRVEVQI